jgi:hypothetical protein
MGPRASALRAVAAGVLTGLVVGSAVLRSQVPSQAAAPLPEPALQVSQLLDGHLPIVAEHRYRMAGKVRLLLFWAGKDDVGSARIRWRREGGDSGYDLLIGSDPVRAPRKTNRWGFIMEETCGGMGTVLGVMKKGQEETLDQATSNAAKEAAGVTFDMIRATVDGAESVARVKSAGMARDYSYRDLVPLMEQLVAHPAPPTERRVALPAGGRKGLLMTVADLVHDAAEAVRTTSKAPARKSLPYAYYRKQYDVTRVSSTIEKQASYGGVNFGRAVRSDFEITARGESWTERFSMVFGLDGPLAEIPVFISYQPRWWFKVELVLDERQAF